MAIVAFQPRALPAYIGVHADTKPTTGVGAGTTFYETDTQNTYVYDGTAWYELPAANGGGGGGAVTVADGADVTLGAKADAADTTGGATSISAKTRGIVQLLVALKALLPTALGGHGGLVIEGVASGTAVPVSGTFFQATQPVSAASLPLPTGAATEDGNLVTIATNTAKADPLWPETPNLWDNVSAGAGDSSNAVPLTGQTHCEVTGQVDSATTIYLLRSPDGETFYSFEDVELSGAGAFDFDFDISANPWQIKCITDSAVTVTAWLTGS